MEHSNPKKGFSMSLQPKLSASSRTRRADRSNAAPALPSAIGQVHAAAEDIAPDRDYVIGMGEGKVFTKEIRVERGPRVIPLAEKPWKQRASKEVTATTGVVREGDKPQTVVSPGSADGHSVSSPHHTPATAQEEKSLDQQAAEAIARESRLAVRGDQLANGTSSNGLGRDLDSARVIGMATQASRGGGSSSELSAGARKLGLLEQNMIPGLAQIEGEDAKFRHDLGHRADDLSVQSKAYDETPISEFGAALLRGMGWGGPDGVDAATSSKPDLFKDVEPRHHRLGLGAQPKPPEEAKPRKRKPGEKPRASDQERLKIWEQKANGERRGTASGPSSELSVMDVVEIAGSAEGGGRKRQRAMVLKTQGVPGLNKISVRMESTGEKLFVERSGVSRVSEDDLARDPFNNRKSPPREGSSRPQTGGGGSSHGAKSSKRSRSRSRSRSSDRDVGVEDKVRKRSKKKEKKQHKKAERKGKGGRNERESSASPPLEDEQDRRGRRSGRAERGRPNESPARERQSDRAGFGESDRHRSGESNRGGALASEPAWLRSNIRVRVVHKSYAGGRAYLAKGMVVDVPRKGEATIRMDLGELVLEGVKQRHLETVLPHRGGKVIVVRGREKGATGKLLAKDKDAETALVQVYDDLRAIRLSLDDVAEFTGMLDQDVEDLGY